jgi:hypothetical protein
MLEFMSEKALPLPFLGEIEAAEAVTLEQVRSDLGNFSIDEVLALVPSNFSEHEIEILNARQGCRRSPYNQNRRSHLVIGAILEVCYLAFLVACLPVLVNFPSTG